MSRQLCFFITESFEIIRENVVCEESLSFFIPHATSNHHDPETEDIVDIYSTAITDKREWNGENGRTESVIGLLF